MISIKNVTKYFGRTTALQGASLDISAGDSVALWGSNGAGKTTLIRCVLGLLPFRGAITIGGRDVRSHGKDARMLTGYVPQELSFYDDLGVAEAVMFFARLKGLRVRNAGEVLSPVGLGSDSRKRVRELSGGMKQRLALAIAMLGDPPVLVLDEVTASLDACGRSEFMNLLSTLSGSGRTLLFASHRVEEIGQLARRVVVLDRGQIVSTPTVDDFSSRMGLDAALHLTIRADSRDLAMRHLQDNGFSPQLNGVGVIVPVCGSRKATPFRVLADARIGIDDFELLPALLGSSDAVKRSETP